MSSIKQVFNNLNNRIMLSVARAVVTLVDDSTKMQLLQLSLLKREVRDNVERFQNYGFTSHPHPGAEAAVMFVGGNRDHGLVVAVEDRRYRLKALAEGEVAIYTDEGDKIVMKRNNVIEITTETYRINAGTKVEINTPLYEVNATDQASINTATYEVSATSQASISTALFSVVAPTSTFSGNVAAGGSVSDVVGSMAAMRTVYNGHTHNDPQGGTIPAPNQSM